VNAIENLPSIEVGLGKIKKQPVQFANRKMIKLHSLKNRFGLFKIFESFPIFLPLLSNVYEFGRRWMTIQYEKEISKTRHVLS
jgi:hypothetical protein